MGALCFVAIADAHTQGGNMKFLPEIVERINGLAAAKMGGGPGGVQAPALQSEGDRRGETALDFVISLAGGVEYGTGGVWVPRRARGPSRTSRHPCPFVCATPHIARQ